MKIREVSLTDITLAMIFPFLINKFEFRTEEEIKTMVKTDDIDDTVVQDTDDDDDDRDNGSGDDEEMEGGYVGIYNRKPDACHSID